MDERILQLRVGIFVLLAFLILAFLIYLNSEMWKGKYTVYLKPATAPGVTRNTPVRKNGVLIGRVAAVSTEDDHVLIRMNIDIDEHIYENEVASIGTDSILGDAVIEILPLTKDQRGEPVRPGEVIAQVSVKRNPMEIIDVALNLETKISSTLETIDSAGLAVQDAGREVEQLSRTIQEAMGDDTGQLKATLDEFRTMSIKAQTALDNFNRIFENINDLVGDAEMKNRIRETIETLPEIFDEVRNTVADTRVTINSFQKVSERATTNLDNLEDFTASLKAEGPEIVRKINDSLDKVDGLFSEFERAADSLSKLQNSEGTIGKLLNDPELYNAAMDTVRNVRDLSVRLEPLVNDLRMFADALARDPGVIGVRGAVKNRDALNTGYKGNAVGRERVQR